MLKISEVLPKEGLRATLIVNPAAGKSADKSIKQAFNLLVQKGIDVELLYTERKGHAESIARDIAARSLDKGSQVNHIVIAAGGDGTYNEVANGLVHTPIPMAILPMGTTSVLARELLIPLDIKRAVDMLVEGVVIDVNLGLIECSGGKTRRHFLLMAGIGFDGETVSAVNTEDKRRLGKAAYILSGIKQFASYGGNYIQAQVAENRFIHGMPDSKGDNWAVLDCTNLIVGKGAFYGGYFRVTPDASLRGRSFFCFATKLRGKMPLIRYITSIILHKHLKLSDTRYFEAHEMYIVGNAHIQIDGDYIGILPANLTVLERCLRMVVGRPFLRDR